MSTDNPDVTASDIVVDIESKLQGTNLDTTDYLPWISYAYQKLYRAIVSAGQQVKEYYFGDYITFNLSGGNNEYSLSTNIPRFGGMIKAEILYGGTNDTWTKLTRLPSLNNYGQTMNNVDTNYQSKQNPLYYILQDTIGIIPTPPAGDAGTPQIKVWYVKRPYQINDGADVIDIPYRYLEPLNDYVHAKAIQSENESYGESDMIEKNFDRKLQGITEDVENEFGEYEGTDSVQPFSGGRLHSNPMRKI